MPCPQHAAKTNAIAYGILCEFSESYALVFVATRYKQPIEN
jgi:hypothetical protein